MKKSTIITIVVVIIVIILGIYFFSRKSSTDIDVTPEENIPTTPVSTTTGTPTTTPATSNNAPEVTIGTSVGGRNITAYHFGTGGKEIVFIGGIHGGYEWNTALVAYQLINYLKDNPTTVPAGVKVTVIPVLNPDGLNKVVGTTGGDFTAADVSASTDTVIAGRFNGNNVDLNRNFDCDWQATGKWQSRTVSGGTAAFSEPESQAIKTYVETNKPAAVVVWYSAAGGVYASNCHGGVSAATDALMNTFASASGYPANSSFDFYATTGDMTNWLAKMGVPAISVLLTNHNDTEWAKNLAGVKAVLRQ